ncbi:unnamed protein product [Prorocentrum cordatum]|uniref:Uncharacterized protein n=1 Tax=Prorocentrum cordatum TaxID=2364126 RepID=A0ABN9RUH7_9DINO|nr:unnamed protein product [Polarella glacialis]
MSLLSELRKAKLEPDIISSTFYSAGVSACEKGEQWHRALSLLSEMREAKPKPNVICYNAGISACEKSDQWEWALSLFIEMRESRLEPDVISYGAGISACEKGDEWQRALSLLSEMREVKVERNVICYNAGISACEKSKQWQQALSLLIDMREARLEPDVISYNAGASACEKGKQWQRALALLSEMRDFGLEPNVISYSAGIRACEVSELWTKALDLLESMLSARVDPAAADSPDSGLYVHNVEAGGPKDVFKHLVLVALLQQMAAEADPFTFIDMHAASGVYDLSSEEPLQFRMAEKGVLRLSLASDRCGEGLVADYLAAVWRCNQALGSSSRALAFYPGSPALAWQWLRSQDTAVLFEAAAEPYEALRQSFSLLGRGPGCRLELLHDDSYLRVASGPWPWPGGRQLVLLDPPYDSLQSQNTRNVFVLRRLLQRSPSSCVALWYPLVDAEKTAGLHRRVQSLEVGSVLVAEMWLGGSWPRGEALQGSGVLVVNPPPAVHAQLLAALPGLQGALRAAGSRVLWL